MTHTTPVSGDFSPGVGRAVVDAFAKFKESSFIHSRNIEGRLKFKQGSRYPDRAPFGVKFFSPGGTSSVPETLNRFLIFKRVT